jgi:hypothetical protein
MDGASHRGDHPDVVRGKRKGSDAGKDLPEAPDGLFDRVPPLHAPCSSARDWSDAVVPSLSIY